MNKTNDHLESLNQIRSIMERSTTILSLTGLSGIMAGFYGILAFILVSLKLNSLYLDMNIVERLSSESELQLFLIVVASCTLVLTLLTALGLTIKKAQRSGYKIWDNASKQFILHLFLPLISGGLFIISLTYHNQFQFVCPAMLLFFGLALINGARFVKLDMFWFGMSELFLGIIASFWYQGGLILWVLGFGFASLIYGTWMYYKYER